DKIQAFEVVLAEHQSATEVKHGRFVRSNYGLKKGGLVFIPNRNLEIHDNEQGKFYHVVIRETAQFFSSTKENSDFNRY
ncbi:relaxase, partial [Streptococcus suis]